MRKLTRLGRFLRDNGVKLTLLADVTGVSRQHILRLRKGDASLRGEPQS